MASSVADFRKAVHKAKYDPDWFCEKILRSPNDPWQSEMLNAVADLERIKAGIPTLYNHEGMTRFTICAFHGPGKTHYMAKQAHWWNFVGMGKIPCTAPKEKQLITRLWPEFNDLRNGALKEYQQIMEVNRKSVEWAGDMNWAMIAESASSPENLAGYHHKRLLYLVEEASGVEDRMFEVVEGALTTEGAVLILIGNPTKTEGEFYRSHTHRDTADLYYRKKIQHTESNRIKKEWVDGMIRKYGKDSPAVQIRVFGNFVEMMANQLYALSWVENCVGNGEGDGSIPKLRITVDVADGGDDETVITVGKHFESKTVLKKMHRFSFPPSESPILAAEAADRIAKAYKFDAANGDDMVVDALGVGAGTAGYLMKLGYPVIQYRGGESSDNPKKWKNRRTQSHIVLRDELRDGLIDISSDFLETSEDWDDFYGQLTSIKLKPGTERVEDLETKQEMLRRGIKSPDMVDSVAMQFATQTPVTGTPESEPILIGELETVNDDASLL